MEQKNAHEECDSDERNGWFVNGTLFNFPEDWNVKKSIPICLAMFIDHSYL